MTEKHCRRVVAARSGGKCEHCLVRRGTDMSHRKPRSQGGLWSAENIAHSCRDCHVWLESHPVRAHELGWRLWRSEDPAAVPFLRGGGLLVLLTATGYERFDRRDIA